MRISASTSTLHVELTRFDKATLNSTSNASEPNNERPTLTGDCVQTFLCTSFKRMYPCRTGRQALKVDYELSPRLPSKSIATIRASLVGVAESQTPSVQRIAEPANEVSIKWFNA